MGQSNMQIEPHTLEYHNLQEDFDNNSVRLLKSPILQTISSGIKDVAGRAGLGCLGVS